MNITKMKEDVNVLAHIQNINAELDRRAKEEGWTFYLKVPEHIASEYDTVYDYEWDRAIENYSDSYKEENGFRPHINPDWQLNEIWERTNALYS